MELDWSNKIGFGSGGSYGFPDEDGVYVIAEMNNDIADVRYVGQGNIHDRMKDHVNWENEPNKCLAGVMKDTSNVKVVSVVINNETDRDNVEYTLYAKYLQAEYNLCNEITPHGEYITGLLLPF